MSGSNYKYYGSLPYPVHTEPKPWGQFTQFSENQETTVKIIEVNPQEVLSLQKHKYRDELWVALDDHLSAFIDDRRLNFKKGKLLYIPRKTAHRISNTSTHRPARFLEVAFGIFDEADIQRIEDKYGRK